MKEIESISAEKAIMFDVEFDTNIEKIKINAIGTRNSPYFIPCIPFEFKV